MFLMCVRYYVRSLDFCFFLSGNIVTVRLFTMVIYEICFDLENCVVLDFHVKAYVSIFKKKTKIVTSH